MRSIVAAIHAVNRRYPWRDMGIGDSFVVPREEGKDPRRMQSDLVSAARGPMAKIPGFRVTTSVQPDGSVRVWRIA